MKTTILNCNNAYKQKMGRSNTMKKGILLISLVIFILGIFSISAVFGLTASIDKPKMVLYKNITGDKLVFQESVIVNNENAYAVRIILTPSGDWKDRATIDENNFTMEANTSKEVFYEITIEKAGDYAGDILVSFSENASQIEGSLAQRLIVHVTEENSSNISYWLIAFGVLVVIVAILVLILVRRKSKNPRVSSSFAKEVSSRK